MKIIKFCHPIRYILLTVLIATGCSLEENRTVETDDVKVKVEPVSLLPGKSNYYIGTVEESSSIPLSFLTTGLVEKVFVSEGQKVKKGDLLVILDTQNYKNALHMAVAKEKQAEDAYRRLSELYKKGSLPEIKFVEVETGLSQARSATDMVRKNLEDCRLYSPANGVIGKRSIEPGSNVMPYNTVLTLVDINQVFVRVPVPEKEISAIQKGEAALVSVPALSGETYKGKIEEKGVMANPISHTYEVKVILDNPLEKLLPGMVCKIWLGNENNQLQVIIPIHAVQVDGVGQKYVYTADPLKKQVIRKNIVTGEVSGNGVSVTGGLTQGDLLIVAGYQHLNEKSTINIVK